MKYRKNKFDLSLCRYVRRQSKIHPSRLNFFCNSENEIILSSFYTILFRETLHR